MLRPSESFALKVSVLALLMLPSFVSSQTGTPPSSPALNGVTFIKGSSTQLILERDGRKYLVDAAAQTVTEIQDGATSSSKPPEEKTLSSRAAQAPPKMPAPTPESGPDIYKAGDDLVFSVPTGRRPVKHGMYINFTHRFPYEAAFSGPARGATLLGLDDFAIPAFGFRYGVTDKFSVFAYRAPSIIGRPIELMAAYNFLDEKDGQPFNASIRFSI